MVADEWWSYHAAESLQVAEESIHVSECPWLSPPRDDVRNAFRVIANGEGSS